MTAGWLPAAPEQGEQGRKDGGRRFVDIGRTALTLCSRENVSSAPASLASPARPVRGGQPGSAGNRSAPVGGIQRVKQPEQGDIGDGKVAIRWLLSRRIAIRRWHFARSATAMCPDAVPARHGR